MSSQGTDFMVTELFPLPLSLQMLAVIPGVRVVVVGRPNMSAASTSPRTPPERLAGDDDGADVSDRLSVDFHVVHWAQPSRLG
jgi:hypothetical protein